MMKMITLWLSPEQIRALDMLVRKGYYPSRAEAIRFAISDLLNSEQKYL